MKISEILTKKSIRINVEVKTKKDLLLQLLDLAKESGKISNPDNAAKEIFERERIMSTGVGKGIALPHAKTDAVEDSIGAIALLKKPIDYDSLDGMPVNIAFMLLGKEHNVGYHLRLLSKISRYLNNDNFREKLLNCKTEDEVFEAFIEIEQND